MSDILNLPNLTNFINVSPIPFYYKGQSVYNGELSYDKEDFIVDTVFGPTYESFGSDNVILLDDVVCYFKWFISGTNDKVYATKYGDVVLKYDQIKNGQRLQKNSNLV